MGVDLIKTRRRCWDLYCGFPRIMTIAVSHLLSISHSHETCLCLLFSVFNVCLRRKKKKVSCAGLLGPKLSHYRDLKTSSLRRELRARLSIQSLLCYTNRVPQREMSDDVLTVASVSRVLCVSGKYHHSPAAVN